MIRLCFATTFLRRLGPAEKGNAGGLLEQPARFSESRIPRQPHRRRSVGAAPCREAWRCGRRELVSRYSLRPWARAVLAPEHSDCGSSALHFPCESRVGLLTFTGNHELHSSCAEAVTIAEICGCVRKNRFLNCAFRPCSLNSRQFSPKEKTNVAERSKYFETRCASWRSDGSRRLSSRSGSC